MTRHQLQDLAVELLKEKTVLLITHDPQEALRVSDEIRILRHQPAELSPAIILDCSRPRELGSQALWELQQQLFDELTSGAK